MPNSANAPLASAPLRMTSSASRFRWPIFAPQLRTRWHRARLAKPSIVLQEPLDVIKFDLRTLRIGQTPAKLLENPAHPLHIDLAGNLHRQIVAEVAPVQGPPQRIARNVVTLLPASAVAGAVTLTVAVALLHGFGKALRPLAQGIERLALRIDGAIGVALAKLAAGIAHRVIGRAKTVIIIAGLAVAILPRLLALLTLLTALAWPHAALGQFLLQLLQAVAQALLILLEIAHPLIALLAALAVATGILALLERLVAQLLLLADHVAEFVERLLHVVFAGLAGLRQLEALQHLLQLIEQLLCRILVAGARQPLQPVDH